MPQSRSPTSSSFKPIEGHLIIDLNAAEKICFIEVLGRPDVRYLIEEYFDSLK
jgi:hypothetical protein